MKRSVVLFAVLFAAAPMAAMAATPGNICVNPHLDYDAHSIGHRDVVVRSSLGHDRPEVKLTTTCFDLDATSLIRVSSPFNCIGQGDFVLASNIDGHRQRCRITGVAPYVHADAGLHG
jgi:hypothetical protein